MFQQIPQQGTRDEVTDILAQSVIGLFPLIRLFLSAHY